MALSSSHQSVKLASTESGDLDAIDVEEPPRPASRVTMEPRHETEAFDRLHMIWNDLLFTDKSVSAVTTLHSYGYFVSLFMTLWGWSKFAEYGPTATIIVKGLMQFIGLNVSLLGVYACYSKQPKKLSLFFIYQLTQTILVFLGLHYLWRTSRREMFQEYLTQPFYNLKLVDYPFGADKGVLDMSAEPAYELSLLYFRAFYMLIFTIALNMYTLYSVGTKLWSQQQPSIPQGQVDLALQRLDVRTDARDDEERDIGGEHIRSGDRQMSLGNRIGLLFGLYE